MCRNYKFRICGVRIANSHQRERPIQTAYKKRILKVSVWNDSDSCPADQLLIKQSKHPKGN